MNKEQRMTEIDDLIFYVQKINKVHHKQIEKLLHAIKDEGVNHSELKLLITDLHHVTEEYVISVTKLVDGIKKASLRYFSKVVAKFEIC